MTTITLTQDAHPDEVEGKNMWIWIFLLQLGPGLIEHLVYRHNGFLPSIRPHGLLPKSRQLLQRRRCIMHIHSTVLCLFEMIKNAHDGLTDSWEGGGAEDTVATVEKGDFLILEVHDKADLNAPVQERARAYEGISHATGGSLFPEGGLDRDFALENRESGALFVQEVGAEFGGDEAFDVAFGSGFDQEQLFFHTSGGEG